jgi:hypothetical protein
MAAGQKAAEPGPLPLAETVTTIVDRFLASKRISKEEPHGCTLPAVVAGSEAGQPAPPELEVKVVDFVCENDVREAVRESRKIFIGPKTIVTPSAREFASQYDTLVVAKR